MILLDQFTKIADPEGVRATASPHEVTPFFNLVLAHNPGAAFSFLAIAGGWQRWFFTALGVVAALFIFWLLKRHGGQKLFCSALALILGGAIGNVIDRLMYGHVVDFLDFHVRSVALPGVQRRRQRDHDRRDPAHPRRAAARARLAVTRIGRPRFVGGFRWQPQNSQENTSSSA